MTSRYEQTMSIYETANVMIASGEHDAKSAETIYIESLSASGVSKEPHTEKTLKDFSTALEMIKEKIAVRDRPVTAGRPPKHGLAMSNRERQKQHYQKQKRALDAVKEAHQAMREGDNSRALMIIQNCVID